MAKATHGLQKVALALLLAVSLSVAFPNVNLVERSFSSSEYSVTFNNKRIYKQIKFQILRRKVTIKCLASLDNWF
jgi:hypothetical protein